MKIINQYCQWIQPPPADTLQVIERAGRTCYKSEDKITPDSAAKFVKTIMASQHESVIEHVSASMLFVTDRGVTHEIVRHRIASYSQESTRYCNYCKEKFGGDITFVLPVRFAKDWGDMKNPRSIVLSPMQVRYARWRMAMEYAETKYRDDIADDATPQEARDLLPNSLKTEIVMTANMREWRHFFKLRCSPKAHPQMQDLAKQALKMFTEAVPVLFDDLRDMRLENTPLAA